MAMLFARRLVAGTQEWSKVPSMWRAAVHIILVSWVDDRTISQEQFTEITGEDIPETNNES